LTAIGRRGGGGKYTATLGGDDTEPAAMGEKTGPGVDYDESGPAIERIVRAYLDVRQSPEETFLETYRRTGIDPFKAALYDEEGEKDAA